MPVDKKRKKKAPEEEGTKDPSPPAAESAEPSDEHPWAVGAYLVAEWGTEKPPRLCQIIERGELLNPTNVVRLGRGLDVARLTFFPFFAAEAVGEEIDFSWSYYVHWLDFNRRMDEW